jgi:uncharacterized membrane protein YecN with MAPEG domain
MAPELEHDPTLPPPAEVIHLPEPSYLPAALALGITLSLVGILTWWWVIAIGVIITLSTLVLWIRSAREEFNDLPLDH